MEDFSQELPQETTLPYQKEAEESLQKTEDISLGLENLMEDKEEIEDLKNSEEVSYEALRSALNKFEMNYSRLLGSIGEENKKVKFRANISRESYSKLPKVTMRVSQEGVIDVIKIVFEKLIESIIFAGKKLMAWSRQLGHYLVDLKGKAKDLIKLLDNHLATRKTAPLLNEHYSEQFYNFLRVNYPGIFWLGNNTITEFRGPSGAGDALIECSSKYADFQVPDLRDVQIGTTSIFNENVLNFFKDISISASGVIKDTSRPLIENILYKESINSAEEQGTVNIYNCDHRFVYYFVVVKTRDDKPLKVKEGKIDYRKLKHPEIKREDIRPQDMNTFCFNDVGAYIRRLCNTIIINHPKIVSSISQVPSQTRKLESVIKDELKSIGLDSKNNTEVSINARAFSTICIKMFNTYYYEITRSKLQLHAAMFKIAKQLLQYLVGSGQA